MALLLKLAIQIYVYIYRCIHIGKILEIRGHNDVILSRTYTYRIHRQRRAAGCFLISATHNFFYRQSLCIQHIIELCDNVYVYDKHH